MSTIKKAEIKLLAGLTTTDEPHNNPDTEHYDSDSVMKRGHLFVEAASDTAI